MNSSATLAASDLALVTDVAWIGAGTMEAKSLLLFFDGLATAFPDAYFKDMLRWDPVIVGPLLDAGVMRNISPVDWAHPSVAEAIDELSWLCITNWRDPSADTFLKRDDVPDDRSWELLSYLQDLYGVVAFSGWARSPGSRESQSDWIARNWREVSSVTVPMALVCAADLRQAVTPIAVREKTLELVSPSSSLGRIITSDLLAVAPDLSRVPLDEIIGFRKEHRQDLYSYMSEVKSLATWLMMHPEATEAELAKRQEYLRDQVSELKKATRKAFRLQMGSILIGASAAAWTVHQGDPIGAALAAIGTAVSALGTGSPPTARCYVVEARRSLAR